MNQSKELSISAAIKSKMAEYAMLSKLRLSSFVVFSSIIGYIFGSLTTGFSLTKLIYFAIGGSMVTFASNAINQFIERDSDKLMTRTANRPLPSKTMSQFEALIFIGITAIGGILLLTIVINPITGVLSALSLFIYGFLYTPMKKISPIAVMIGAIPGAIPPLLGYVAATNQMTEIALWLFLVQFFWQFPHFWSIAWLSYDDYKKADIMLLPNAEGKTKQSAKITLIYTLVLIPLAFYPIWLTHNFTIGNAIMILASTIFSYYAYNFYVKCDDSSAKKLMFGSFIYLIVFLISIFI